MLSNALITVGWVWPKQWKRSSRLSFCAHMLICGWNWTNKNRKCVVAFCQSLFACNWVWHTDEQAHLVFPVVNVLIYLSLFEQALRKDIWYVFLSMWFYLVEFGWTNRHCTTYQMVLCPSLFTLSWLDVNNEWKRTTCTSSCPWTLICG